MSLPLPVKLCSLSVETTRCYFMDVSLVAEVLPLNYTRILNVRFKKSDKKKMVGKTGFEPATPWSQTRCSTKLSHFPFTLNWPGKRRVTPDVLIRRQILIRTDPNNYIWCRGPDLNRHGSHLPQDFKSCASASSATPACLVYMNYYFNKIGGGNRI